MLSGLNGLVLMEGRGEEAGSWIRNSNSNNGVVESKKDDMGSLSTFKSILDAEDVRYLTSNAGQNYQGIRDISFSSNLTGADNLLLHPVNSSSSCFTSSSVFNNLDPSQVHLFLPPKPTLSSLLNPVSNDPLEHGFDMGSEQGFLVDHFTDLGSDAHLSFPSLISEPQFGIARQLQMAETGALIGVGFSSEEGSMDAQFLNRSKLLRPLETFPSIGARPALFQKRAAFRKNLTDGDQVLSAIEGDKGKREMGEENDREWRNRNAEDVEDASIDGSGLNYDSDELKGYGESRGNNSNVNRTSTPGDHKGKKKGLPAKNLMAERRRRKKLNDRLYMLRSVVPKISRVMKPFPSNFID